ncbi:hypothetical protein [Profundibacter sp.]
MKISFIHDGKNFEAWTYGSAQEANIPAAVIGAALKNAAASEVTVFSNHNRSRLASHSAGKLAEYRFKEEIAGDPSAAPDDELVLLDREAAARGIDRDALLALISAKATAYRTIALLIGVLEAEAKAAIATIADDLPDIEAQIETALVAAKAQAETAFEEAQTLLNGGA